MTYLTFKLCIYAKLNCLKFNSALKTPKRVDTPKAKQPTNQHNVK